MRSLGIFLSIAMLSACSAQSDPPEPEAGRSSPGDQAEVESKPVIYTLPTVATPAWSVKMRALGNPTPAGDTLVLVVEARADELDIVGLDRATGQERWRSPFLTTGNRDGLYLGELVYESEEGNTYVVFQQAPEDDALAGGKPQPYVALEPATGEVVGRTRPVRSTYGPVACDDGYDVCLRLAGGDDYDTRWDLDTWKLRPEINPLPDGANALRDGSDIYTVNGDVDGFSAAVSVGRVGTGGWQVPARRIVRNEGWLLSDDGGLVDDEAGIAVMELNRKVTPAEQRRYDAGEEVVLDQSKRETVGIDTATGRVVWRHRGADFDCLELVRWEVPVRCAFKGGMAYRSSWKEQRLRRALASLEGYNPVTGDTTWSHPLSKRATEILLLHEDDFEAAVDWFADADELMVVPTKQGNTLVSLLDGSSRQVRRDVPLLCRLKVLYPYALDERNIFENPYLQQRVRYTRRPCDSRGKDSKEPLDSTALLTGAEDTGDGTWVFATFDTVEAYRVS